MLGQLLLSKTFVEETTMSRTLQTYVALWQRQCVEFAELLCEYHLNDECHLHGGWTQIALNNYTTCSTVLHSSSHVKHYSSLFCECGMTHILHDCSIVDLVVESTIIILAIQSICAT